MASWRYYSKKLKQKMRPYIFGEDLSRVSVSPEDVAEVSDSNRENYGMIAVNEANPSDQWYINYNFFRDNYIEVQA